MDILHGNGITTRACSGNTVNLESAKAEEPLVLFQREKEREGGRERGERQGRNGRSRLGERSGGCGKEAWGWREGNRRLYLCEVTQIFK